MAATIKNFLVGVGLDSSKFDKGSKDVTENLGRIRSLAGLAGAALVTAFAAASTQAINAGRRIDQFTLSTERMSSSSGFVYNFGNALRLMGGDAAEATSAITSFESALDKLRQGEYPFESLNRAGIDTSALIRATDGADMTRILAEIVPTLDKSQQRILQENFGISDATMRTLRQGREEFDSLLSRSSDLTGEIRQTTDAAREFNKQIAELQLRFEGIGNSLAEKMLPSMNELLKGLGNFIDGQNPKINAATDILGANPIGTGLIAAGGSVAAAGGLASSVGLKTLGTGLSRLGLPGAAVGAGMLAWDIKPKDIEGLTGYRPSDYIFEKTPIDAAKDVYDWGRESGNRLTDNLRLGSYQDMQDSVAPTIEMYTRPSVAQERERAAVIPKVQNNIELRIDLDGRAVEHKVTEVLERRGQATIDDIQSTTVR